jgi:hypothetical protein
MWRSVFALGNGVSTSVDRFQILPALITRFQLQGNRF